MMNNIYLNTKYLLKHIAQVVKSGEMWENNKPWQLLLQITNVYCVFFHYPLLTCLSLHPCCFWNHMQLLWYSLSSWISASLFPIYLTLSTIPLTCITLGKQAHTSDFALPLFSAITTCFERQPLWTCWWMNGSLYSGHGCYANCEQMSPPFLGHSAFSQAH